MSEAPLTLKNCFASDASKPIAGALDLGAIMPSIAAATAALPGAAAAQIRDTFTTALDGIFALNLGDVLMASWGKISALTDALHATRKEPGLLAVVPLFDHKVTSAHKPHIDLTYGGKNLLSVPFDIALSLMLKGIVLDIQNGAIANVKGGSLLGEGTLSFGGKPLLKHKTPELALPGKLAFKAPATDGQIGQATPGRFATNVSLGERSGRDG
jgi:hypothetical protein